MREKFDLIIVGAGAAGFAASIKADEMGAKTLMVNSSLPVGGTCVNAGCVPTKFLLKAAKDYYEANNPRFGSVSLRATVNFKKLMQEKNNLINSLRESNYQYVLANLPNVTYKKGKARFISERQIEVGKERFFAEKFIIAAGCSPKTLPIEGLKEAGFLTSRTALELTDLPETLLVIGAGSVGLELGQFFSRLGTEVVLVELIDRILPHTEPIISEELRECLEEEGIRITAGARIRKIEREEKRKVVHVEKDSKTETFKTSQILLAAGVVGNSRDLGLESLGVNTDKDGFIKVNEYLQTTKNHIFSAGDVTGPPFLETVAAKEGNIAAQNALGGPTLKMDYQNIPYAVFTSPQVAGVGMRESEYMEKHGTCLCRMVKMSKVPKARVVNKTKGLIFMLIHHRTKRIMGVHVISELASEIIHEATLAIRFGLTVDEIIHTVHVFPTFSEAVKITAQSFTRSLKKMSCCVE